MAKFNSAWLISKRQFRSLTGIETGTFRELVERLRPHWRKRIVAPKNRSGRPWGVGGLEDHLLVLLILYRCAITQDFMACLYRTDKSTVSRSLQRIEALAVRVLGVKRAVRVSRQEGRGPDRRLYGTAYPKTKPKTALLVFRKKETSHHQNRNRYHREWPDRQCFQASAGAGS